MANGYENVPVSVRYKDDFYEVGVTVGDYFLVFGGGNKPELVSRLQEAAAAKAESDKSGTSEPSA